MRQPYRFPMLLAGCAAAAVVALSTVKTGSAGDTVVPDPDTWSVHHMPELLARRAASGRAYLPFLDHETLSMGIYVLPGGGQDGQQPHRQDETYFVLEGSGQLVVESETTKVAAGDVIFVAAGTSHRFVDMESGLSLLVFFSKAPTG